jgi:hypothetical protein
MTPKQMRAATEREIAAVVAVVEKFGHSIGSFPWERPRARYHVVAVVEKFGHSIGARFGDIDNTMVTHADDLIATVCHWAKETREYMDQAVEEAKRGEFWTGI